VDIIAGCVRERAAGLSRLAPILTPLLIAGALHRIVNRVRRLARWAEQITDEVRIPAERHSTD
jgi:hypothetical protein